MKERSQERAFNYLLKNLNEGIWKTGTRLPNAKQLAEKAGVSYASILGALKILKNKKKVSFKERVGIFAGSDIPKTKRIHVQKKKFDIILEAIHKDSTIGDFNHNDFLPSIKELSLRYQVGFTVIKKAIAALVDQGIIHQEKTHYRIKRFITKSSIKTIYLFVHENIHLNTMWQFSRDWCNTFIRTIETTCHERNIRLIKINYSRSSPATTDLKDALGFIVYHTLNYQRTPPHQDTIDLLGHLKRYDKPIALVSGNLDQPKLPDSAFAPAKKGNTQLFYCDTKPDEDAGRKVGQILLARGHKKICFFSPANQVEYLDRYRGLCDYFNSVGLNDSIHYFVPDAHAFNWSTGEYTNNSALLTLDIEQFNSELETCFKIVKDSPLTRKMQGLMVEIRKMHKELADSHGNDLTINVPAAQTWSDIMESQLTVNKMRLPHLFKRSIANAIQEVHNAIGLQRIFFPLFEQALHIPGITAWVCAEDHLTNATVLEFCRSKKIKTPEQLGIIGFQDHFESCTNNITSYHFDFAKTALKALSLVTHPRHSAKLFCKKDSGEFTFEGMVIDRGSV